MYIGILIAMLEHETNDKPDDMRIVHSGYKVHECDKLRNIMQAKQILFTNKHIEPQDESNDTDDELTDDD